MKWSTLSLAAAVTLLLLADFLAFHDLLQPHTVRDWLVLAVSALPWSASSADPRALSAWTAQVVERTAGAAALAVLLGFLATRMLFLQWATLIPWAVAAVVVGAISRDRREALAGGAAYGFALGFSFTAFGYGGSDPLLGKVPFFAILGVVSAAFGMALSLAAHWLLPVLRRRSAGGPR